MDNNSRRSNSTKCGHVKRCLNNDEHLKGNVLKFALEVIESATGFSDKEFLNTMAMKLRTGQNLDDYEHHIMVDVLLLHHKLMS